MDELTRACRDRIAKGSRSFALAATLFDPPTRRRAYLLYAWCRYCDDVIDGQELGNGATSPATGDIDLIRRQTRAALASEPTGAMPFEALRQVAAETAMPPRYPLELIDGFAMDVAGRHYATADDLFDYCYHVAGVVGVMMAIVMGVSPQDRATLERAADLGIAFQLCNIARDLCEDAGIGRCYVPAVWLAEERLAASDLAAPASREALARIAARLVAEAERFATSARFGTPALPWRAAWAVLAAADIYCGIGRKVRARGSCAWDRRVATSTMEKLACVARSALLSAARARLWRDPPPRTGLWTKP